MISVSAPVVDAGRLHPDGWRLTVQVRLGDGPGDSEAYWIEGAGPTRSLDASGTPWAVALTPLAATLGVPLRLAAPVDPLVAAGVSEVSRIWATWYPGLAPVRLDAELDAVAPEPPPASSASFFSGGVDSMYTALRRRTPEPGGGCDLLTVHGFDIALERADAFGRMLARFREELAPWGCPVVALSSNFRVTRSGRLPWGPLAHGCALVSAGLALGPRYRCLRVAATGGTRDPHPWGSHLRTDPLLGTSATRVEHDGADAARWEKVRRIAEDAAALGALRVCWRSGSERNCGACSKCLRTMALLDLWGALGRAATFPDRLPLDALARVRVDESWDFREFGDLVALGRAHGRPDLARAATEAMRRARLRSRALDVVERLTRAPAIGATARRVRERLLQDGIA